MAAEKFPLSALFAGIGAGILSVAGVVSLIGPVASDSPSEMAAVLASGRSWALIALFGTGLAAMLGFWFLTALRRWLSLTVPDGGEELGTTALAAAGLFIGLAMVGMSLFYGATYELVNGHRFLPSGGHPTSPLTATFPPHRWPRFLPA